MQEILTALEQRHDLPEEALCALLETDAMDGALFQAADRIRRERYGTEVFVRGLIEFTNYCRNDCYYCGIRRSNGKVQRYRLSREDILACCTEGYALGFRTFVLQGGEDAYFTEQRVCEIVSEIRERFPDCAITLPLASGKNPAMRRFSVPAQTAICCATRPQTRRTTAVSIPAQCRRNTGNAAFLI